MFSQQFVTSVMSSNQTQISKIRSC